MVESAGALMMVALAAVVMIVAALAAGNMVSLATLNALTSVQSMPAGFHLLETLASTPLPILLMVLLQTGSLATTTEFMSEITLMLILYSL